MSDPYADIADPDPYAAVAAPAAPEPPYFNTRLGRAKRVNGMFEGVAPDGSYFSVPETELPDAQPVNLTGTGQAPASVVQTVNPLGPAPTFTQRMFQNIGSASTNTVGGAGLDVLAQGVAELMGTGQQNAADRRAVREYDQAYRPMADFYDPVTGAPQFEQALSDRAAAGLGQVIGSFTSPESLIGGGKRLVDYILTGAGVNTGVDIARQGADVLLGDRQALDANQTLMSTLLGGAVGGTLKGLESTPQALRQVGAWLSSRRAATPGAAPDAPISADELAAMFADPQIGPVLEASGIRPDSPVAPAMAQRVQQRRAAEAQAATPESTAIRDAFDLQLRGEAEQELAQAAARAQEARTTPVAPLTPDEVQNALDLGQFPIAPRPEAIPVAPAIDARGMPTGDPRQAGFDEQSYAGQLDPGTAEALRVLRERYGQRALPSPEQAAPAPLTDTQVNIARRQMEQPTSAPEPPPRLYGGEDIRPRDTAGVQSDREAAQAFQLAERQRARNENPDIRDTQAAPLAEGVQPVRVVLDEGNPVQVLRRETGTDARGRPVDLAIVRRYDPRTGQPDPEGVEYPVRADMLRQSTYTPEPRRAQDFVERARGPTTPERPRMPEQPVAREPAQTFRQTAPDPNQDFPGAQPEGRSPIPPNTSEPPSRRWSTAEEAMRAYQRAEASRAQERASRQRAYEEAKARGESAEPPLRDSAQAEAKYRGQSSSNAARPPENGRFATDEFGYVLSDKGPPIKFADQKQAARYIIGVAQKNSDGQVFEIANHPTGGFTIKAADMDVPPPKGDGAPPPNDGEPPSREQSDAAGEPPAADASKSSGPSRQSLTMGSNQFLEPLANALSNAIGREAKQVLRGIQNAIEDTAAWARARQGGAPIKTPDFVQGALGLAKAVYYTKDGEMRAIVNRTGSPAIQRIADMFHAPVGGERAVGDTFFDGISREVGRRTNAVENVLRQEFGADGVLMRNRDRDAAMTQIVQLVRNRSAINPKTPVGRAAAVIAKELDEFHAYLKKAGMDIGVQKNYYPRMPNVEQIMLEPGRFKIDAQRAYQAEGMTAADAKAAAEAWYQNILLADIGVRAEANDFVSFGGAVRSQAEKSRVLSQKAEKVLADGGWYIDNPAEALPQYFYTMSRRAEWTRRMGADMGEWKKMKDAVFAEQTEKDRILAITDKAKRDAERDRLGYTEAQLNERTDTHLGEVVDMVSNLAGLTRTNLRAWGNSAASTVRAASTLTFLAKTAFLQLSEPALLAVRTGRADDAFRAYVTSVRDLLGYARKDREIAEALGVVEKTMGDMVSSITGGPLDAYGRKPTVENFFKQTGQYYLTNAQRVGTTTAAAVAVKRWAKEFLKTPSESLKSYLREVGIPDDKMTAFAKWATADEARLFDVNVYKGDAEMNAMLKTAIARIVDQSVMRPTRATRPRWADHPFGSIVYGLTSFTYAFQKNVLNRVGTLAKRAVSEGGLTMADRARFLAPSLMLGAVWAPLAYAVWELRAKVFEDKRKPIEYPEKWFDWGGGQVERFVNATGVAGVMQSPLSMLTQLRYSRDPAQAVLGPELGIMAELFGRTITALSPRNNPNTNTAERQLAQTGYQAVLQPLMAAAIARTIPVGTPLLTAGAGALQQAIASPTVRENVVTAVAGEKKKPKKKDY